MVVVTGEWFVRTALKREWGEINKIEDILTSHRESG